MNWPKVFCWACSAIIFRAGSARGRRLHRRESCYPMCDLEQNRYGSVKCESVVSDATKVGRGYPAATKDVRVSSATTPWWTFRRVAYAVMTRGEPDLGVWTS